MKTDVQIGGVLCEALGPLCESLGDKNQVITNYHLRAKKQGGLTEDSITYLAQQRADQKPPNCSLML